MKRTLEEITYKIAGKEPLFTSEKEISEVELIDALNWYSINTENSHKEKYIREYLKNMDLNYKIPVSAWLSQGVLVHLCRMKCRGAVFPIKYEESFQSRFKFFVENYIEEKVEQKSASNVISIQDRIEESVNYCIGELEGYIDDLIEKDQKSSVKALFMEKSIKTVHANKISVWAKTKRKEFFDALKPKDEYVKEAYINFKKKTLKAVVAFLDEVILECMSLVQERKNTRKPRKRKEKTPQQLVSKMLYMTEHKEYGKSIDPYRIVGSTQIWVFNVKTRKLGVYNALDASGLSVKGSSIVNYNEDTSICKTIRKPEQIIPDILKGGKTFLKNVIGSIKSKEAALTGRINRDTLLLRIN